MYLDGKVLNIKGRIVKVEKDNSFILCNFSAEYDIDDLEVGMCVIVEGEIQNDVLIVTNLRYKYKAKKGNPIGQI